MTLAYKRNKEDSSFSEEKEAKRRLSVGGSHQTDVAIRLGAWHPPRSAYKSLFASFSSEKEESLPFLPSFT
jgi:hypothetical protein